MRRATVLLGLLSLVVILTALMIGPLGMLPWQAHDFFTNPIMRIRFPRVMAGFAVGAGLALCGLLYQSLFRSVLATPFTLGVSSGAACGAALSLMLGISSFFPPALAGTLGALCTVALIGGIAARGRGEYSATLLLCGVAASFFFSSVILLLQYIGSMSEVFRLTRWMLGGLDTVTGIRATILTLVSLAAAIWFYLRARALDLLAFGEEMSISRGLAARRVQSELFVVSSIVIGIVVSLAGPIGFIGIVVPTVLRLMYGASHQRLIPLSFFSGGIFLVLCDTAARTIAAPVEIPVGVITALLGAPFLAWLVVRSHNGTT
jgi:iron complex transport system permease protein